MIKKIYLSLFVAMLLTLTAAKSEAQYIITSVNWVPQIDSGACNPPIANVLTNTYSSSLSIKTYFGDGTSIISPISNGSSYGYCYSNSNYSFPGSYTCKFILYNSSLAVDSTITKSEYLFCSTAILKFVMDSLGTGIYDSLYDRYIKMPITVEVDYNGIPYDTFTTTSGYYYTMTGAPGDIYAFKIINIPSGIILSFPASNVLYDTIKYPNNNYAPQYFGFKCTGTTSFDLAVYDAGSVTGIHDQGGGIFVSNTYCDPVDATVIMNFSPKYVYDGGAYPTPSSVSGNTITWNLSGISFSSSPIMLVYSFVDSAGGLIAGDTVHEYIQVTPISGDINPANNTCLIIDTVKAGVDPNKMSVSPSGYINAGTQLQYTIGFENTGNDTAFNISVYDTLSDNVDVKSLNIIMASAVMNIAVLNIGGQNIIRFDFPNINLLDSSHHGQCNGAVIFTINTLSGLPAGTTILNHAGIFFDYNPVVMTNTVENIIGIPTSATALNKGSKISVYPNPANDVVIITGVQQNTSYRLLNVTGILMQQGSLEYGSNTLSVKSVTPGIYILEMTGDDGKRDILKMVKE